MDKQIIILSVITLIFILFIILLVNYNFLPIEKDEKIEKNQNTNDNRGVKPIINIDHKQVLDELNILIKIQSKHTLTYELGVDHPLYINDKHFTRMLKTITTEINNMMADNLRNQLHLIFSEEGLQRYIIYLIYPIIVDFSKNINIPK